MLRAAPLACSAKCLLVRNRLWRRLFSSSQDDCEHRQIKENHRPPTHFGKTVRNVIPAPDSRSPAEKHRPDNLAAGTGNQPKNETVEKPALRHKRREQEKESIAIPISKQR